MKLCPKCGKEMNEGPEWPGLWICPDYREPVNEVPPFRFRCDGIELTEEAVKAFDGEMQRLRERN